MPPWLTILLRVIVAILSVFIDHIALGMSHRVHTSAPAEPDGLRRTP